MKVISYTERFFEGIPYSVIVLENKEGVQTDYISKGCVFKKDTPSTRKALLRSLIVKKSW